MPNRPGNDERNTAGGGAAGSGGASGMGDRNGQRDVSSENGRQTGAGGGAGTGGAIQGGARTRSNRGFASMDRGKQKEIASKGGRAAHAKGTAHEFDSSEAREAGRKGGVTVSRNREHMANIGRRGGEARGHSRARASAQTNSGASESIDGAMQNSRNGSSAERQVPINNQNEGVAASTQGSRGGNASLGGERRPQGTMESSSSSGSNGNAVRDESYGNH